MSAEEAPRSEPETPRVRREALVAAAVGFLLGLPTLRDFFVADDFVSLYSVSVTPPWRYLWSNWLGVSGQGGFYRPVFNWALGLCYLVHRIDPVPYRLLLLGLFAANCALVVWLASRATLSAAGALAAGLFFAAHPVHHECIGWIGSILEQLCAFFFLLSIHWFDRAARGPARARSIGLSALMMALSLGSKEMGIVIPGVASLWDLFVLRGRPRLRLWAPLWGLAAAYVALRFAVLGGLGGYGDKHLRFGAADNYLVHYLHFLLDPLPAPWLDRSAGGKALTVAAAGLVGLWALGRAAGLPRARGAWLGLGWFFAAWLPISTLLRPQYLFQPSVGVAIAVGAVFGALLDEARRRGQIGLAAALVLGGFLWMLTAGGALLGHLKLWESGGQTAESVLRQSQDLLRDAPQHTMVFYEKLPVNIGVPVFQHGIAEAVRLFLRRDDLDAERVGSFGELPALVDPWRARYFSYDEGTLRDRTAEIRARSGLAPH
jgi:hypothetical protein